MLVNVYNLMNNRLDAWWWLLGGGGFNCNVRIANP